MIKKPINKTKPVKVEKTPTKAYIPPADTLILYRNSWFLITRFGMPGNSRTLDEDEAEVQVKGEAPKDNKSKEERRKMLEARKKLLDSPELEAVRSFDSKVRRSLYRYALESPFNNRGIYLIPRDLYEVVNKFLNEKFAERQSLIESFMETYPKCREEARKSLVDAFDPADYPPDNIMRRKFKMFWSVKSINQAENVETLGDAIAQEEKEKWDNELRENCMNIANTLRVGFKSALNRFVKALKPREDGKKGILHNSNTDALFAFLDTFGAKNKLVDDKDTAMLVEMTKKLCEGKDPKELAIMCRTDEEFREETLKEFETIADLADELVIEDESRDVVII